MIKKVFIAVLCFGILLGIGCGREEGNVIPFSSDRETEEDNKNSLSDAEREKILNELTVFCNEHKEKLNEMSEYFINAVEEISDYKDKKKLPDIEELAGAFTDEESREILEKLNPYYPDAYNYKHEFKQVYYYYPYDYEEEYAAPEFKVVYIKTDGKELERFLDDMDTGWEVRKIDKHLFAVLESWPYT